MAIILVDSCVVTDLADPHSECFEWSASMLEQLDEKNSFIINPIVYAECSVGYRAIEEIEGLVNELGFAVHEIPKEALFLAGKSFVTYKKNKGKKTNVLPDFFIGAHATVKGYRLITRDKGRFSTYFPSLSLIMPHCV